jgi:membrane-associated phospholipid phosphatase
VGRTAADSQFWGWPDLQTVRTFVWVGLAGASWFVLIYGGADYVTSRRALRIAVGFDAEQAIPFFAPAVWVYMTIYALFLMAPFVLRAPERVIALAATHAAVVLVGGVGFLLLPSELAYRPAVVVADGSFTFRLYRFADWLNLNYNLLPSLHVALSVACVAVYAPFARRAGRLVLWSWALAVALSTIFTHFHHVLDAVTGFALGAAGARVVYPRVAGDSGRARPPLPAAHDDGSDKREQDANR